MERTQRTTHPILSMLLLLALAWAPGVHAERMSPEQLPSVLRDWVDWVRFSDRQAGCPFVYNQFEERRCAWSTELELELTREGGRFRQRWSAQASGWLVLPGGGRHWPQEVRIDGRAATVGVHDARPAIRIEPGSHLVSGSFSWSRRPESLPIPSDTALVRLNIDGHAVGTPQLDDNGNLWLRSQAGQPDAAGTENRLSLRVFRRVVDEIPLQLVTHIELQVSGAAREERLTGALPQGFIPLQLDTRLPARLEADGTLRLQLRPGSWVLELVSRHPGPVTELALGSPTPPWPAEEVWSFEAHPELRLVEVEGAAAVDPAQTELPLPWRSLPAYLMQPGVQLTLHELRRGDPQPSPDALRLHRDLWLDFDGGGYTIRDQIGGTVNRGWRMTMNAPTRLGQVLLDGSQQLITAGADGRAGVELRQGQLNLLADSRFDASRGQLPAVGWDEDFQQLDALLHLPPGWKLFAASGVDTVSQTWTRSWTLLDIFLVLIAALAVRALWDWRAGVLALVTLVLVWHEPGAPRVVWLHLAGTIALLRVLPEGAFARIVTAWRNLAFIALFLIALPFMASQLRNGIYPQLENPGTPPTLLEMAGFAPPGVQQAADAEVQAAASAPGISKRVAMEPALMSASTRERMAGTDVAEARQSLAATDPDALLQTGPGLPDWRWRDVPLGWNGPVQRDQQISLTLLSPRVNLLLNVLRVLLLAALALAFILGSRRHDTAKGAAKDAAKGAGSGAAGALALACLLPTALLHAPVTHAAIPDEALLGQLRERLGAAPECLPECAQFQRLRIELERDTLTLRAEMHALEDTAVPLPINARAWLPGEASLDGSAAPALLRARDGVLWIRLDPGVHQLVLRGATPASETFQLPLPLAPRHIDAAIDGWTVEGIADGQPIGAQLQFSRMQTLAGEPETTPELSAGELPALLRVERTLRLGLDWRVETRVSRISPPGTAVVLKVPLLHGEAVTSEAVRVEDGQVLLSLAADAESISWRSTLEQRAQIELLAPDSSNWFETWRVDINPQWHLESSGIAPIHHQDRSGRWLPEWRPWPGESLTLHLTRPAAIAGPTLTLDALRLQTTPGQRATDTSVSLTLRSSRGDQHVVTLPAGATLRSASIDGITQPIRQEGERVTLPVAPGTHTAELVFREDHGIATLLRTPAFDAGIDSVNTRIDLNPGRDRWTLLLGGLPLGPAVLFWGVLIVAVLLAIGLGRLRWTPLGTLSWALLAVGLTQSTAWVGLLVVGWLLALGWRARTDTTRIPRRKFNALQVGLLLLTLLALAMLFEAVKHGLLGYPQMQIAGNGSSAWALHWYQDRSAATLPRAWMLSVPMWAYRALMLAWALWLAFALLHWLRWGWDCVSQGGLWKKQ